jgi:hypothetical protein
MLKKIFDTEKNSANIVVDVTDYTGSVIMEAYIPINNCSEGSHPHMFYWFLLLQCSSEGKQYISSSLQTLEYLRGHQAGYFPHLEI